MRWLGAGIAVFVMLAFVRPAVAAEWHGPDPGPVKSIPALESGHFVFVSVLDMDGPEPAQEDPDAPLLSPHEPAADEAPVMDVVGPREPAFPEPEFDRVLLMDGMMDGVDPAWVPSLADKPLGLLIAEIVTGVDLGRTYDPYDVEVPSMPENLPERLELDDRVLELF